MPPCAPSTTRAVQEATVELSNKGGGGTLDKALTGSQGKAWLEVSQLVEGGYVVKVTPKN